MHKSTKNQSSKLGLLEETMDLSCILLAGASARTIEYRSETCFLDMSNFIIMCTPRLEQLEIEAKPVSLKCLIFLLCAPSDFQTFLRTWFISSGYLNLQASRKSYKWKICIQSINLAKSLFEHSWEFQHAFTWSKNSIEYKSTLFHYIFM